MTNFYIRSEDEQAALGATHMDDIDLITSPRDGLLVIVAVKGGRHVCQLCGGTFDESNPKLRGVEVSFSPGSPKLLMHNGCESKKIQVQNKFRGLEVRRNLARIARASSGIQQAAVDSTPKPVG